MTEHPFIARLKKTVLVADGAMGTMVHQLAREPVECIECASIDMPALISDIHRQYADAGSRLVITNTFAANRITLNRYGRGDETVAINAAAVKLAREAAHAEGFVAGSMGPIIPLSTDDYDDPLKAYQRIEEAVSEQVSAIVAAGIDVLLLETFPTVVQLQKTLSLACLPKNIPIIASLSVGRDGSTADGYAPAQAAEILLKAGASIIGLNCGYGIRALESALKQLEGLDVPISVMPNAGLPQRIDGRLSYGVSEDYFGAEAVRFAGLGARIIGGCCGTTPIHISSAYQQLQQKKIVRRTRVRAVIASSEDAVLTEGALLKKWHARTSVVICEIDPPATTQIARQVAAIKSVAQAGADALCMADNPLATVKVNNLAFAAKIQQEVDIDLMLHLTARDRNLLGLQSYLLGAHLLGIQGILAVTGDPSHLHGGPTNVYDTNSIGILKLAAHLNQGCTAQGKQSRTRTNFSLGVGVNPNPESLVPQLKHLQNKVAAGARMVLTQPVFSNAAADVFLQRVQGINARVFMGVFPVIRSRTAEYLHNEVPGIQVPLSLRTSLAHASSAQEEEEIGMAHARKLVTELAQKRADVYLIAPHTKPNLLAELVALAKGE